MPIALDSNNQTAQYRGKNVKLTRLEFALLQHLIRNADRICTRDEILDMVWGTRFQYDTGTIDVHLNAIRRKLGLSLKEPDRDFPRHGNLLSFRQCARGLYFQYPRIHRWVAVCAWGRLAEKSVGASTAFRPVRKRYTRTSRHISTHVGRDTTDVVANRPTRLSTHIHGAQYQPLYIQNRYQRDDKWTKDSHCLPLILRQI